MNIHISLLEWTDDLEVFILKGYGKSINYHMGLPLLQDVVQSMGQAIKAKEEFAQIQRDEALELPLKPPHKRNWRGSTVAPFAGNNILVLLHIIDSDRGEYNGKKWHGIVERGYKLVYGIVKSIGALESEKPSERMNGLPEEPLTVAKGGVDVDPSNVAPISSFYKGS
ncbi:hypothetical protein IFM89_030595 [Coptis chinensis]|uniref:Uncharacterized protein n=1 Tax=Coptis chinensis TaxID=261450 RepID=A0A835LRZ9_9MAGN|nr:hypothetical protein IFM89_030595 [Coptis chinensis]